MSAGFFSPDDLPSAPTPLDRQLRLGLEEAVGKYFYAYCDAITQVLLSKSDWHFSITEEALRLIINCQNREVYWQILGVIEQLGLCIQEIASEQAIIRVCPSDQKKHPLEIQVGEITAYWDWYEKRDS
ncbi:hypothetical protein [Gloeothece verrucosa]|uniref:Uncharacterized protein n=1 Tax=Gloeothece verrucosa (strain PCC 7822) TaxID=497965 RepID=E0U661_GLOV7|nr:hypothetical protein [Gloeothece verrucosa]ADN12397.1 conserved hypothetical protein [Gloeothece verrucosa PCC 7822]